MSGDEQEEDAFAQYERRQAAAQQKRLAPRLRGAGVRFQEDDLDLAPRRRDLDEEDDGYRRPTPKKKVALSQSRFIQEDDDDDEVLPRSRPLAGPGTSLFKDNVEVTIPIRTVHRNADAVSIPFEARQAAHLLLDGGYVDGSKATPVLERLVERPCDADCIDPSVIVSRAIPTGTCAVYVEEALPVSSVLLACAFGLQYSVQLTPKARTEPTAYDVDTLRFKVYGGPASLVDGAQTFGCYDAVKQAVEDSDEYADKALQWKAYMMALGPLSPAEVANYDWMAEHARAFVDMLSGKLVVVKESEAGLTKRK